MLFLFQTTSVEKKYAIRVSFKVCDGEQSTKTLQTALQTWCNRQTPALNLENPLQCADGSIAFEINPAPGTVPFFKLFLHHETSKIFCLEKEDIYIYIYVY